MGGTFLSTQRAANPRIRRTRTLSKLNAAQQGSPLLCNEKCNGNACGGDAHGAFPHKLLSDAEHSVIYDMNLPRNQEANDDSISMPKRFSRHDEVGSYLKMDLEKNFSEIYDSDNTAGSGRKFDFDAFGAVPYGWVKSTSRLPDAFLYAGGSAMVIEREAEDLQNHESKMQEYRVLLALPEAAVDLKRAKWLSRRPGFTAEAGFLCPLWHTKECKSSGSVVFQFGFPRGVPLSEILPLRHHLPTAKVQLLIHHLMRLTTSVGPAPLRLLGFMDPSMVFLNDQDELEMILPLGCLLSYAGAKAAMYQAVQAGYDWALPPELKRAMVTNDRLFLSDLDVASITDAFAIAVLALRALGQERVHDREIEIEIPDAANDMLKKALHYDPEWRLSGQAALQHPWIVLDVRH